MRPDSLAAHYSPSWTVVVVEPLEVRQRFAVSPFVDCFRIVKVCPHIPYRQLDSRIVLDFRRLRTSDSEIAANYPHLSIVL